MYIDKSRPVVFMGLPHYDGKVNVNTAFVFLTGATTKGVQRIPASEGGSLLSRVFNGLWTKALQQQEQFHITHFAMLHADIVPAVGWLDTLLEEQQRTGADILSVVVPIKNEKGLTSTAIDSKDDPWAIERRITMTEAMALPATFSAADCGFPDRALLLNTGCWIADLRKPWCKQVAFNIKDRIHEGQPQTMSEDWDFSRQVHALGGKLLATRKVRVEHVGSLNYPNDCVWGTLQTDNGRD